MVQGFFQKEKEKGKKGGGRLGLDIIKQACYNKNGSPRMRPASPITEDCL